MAADACRTDGVRAGVWRRGPKRSLPAEIRCIHTLYVVGHDRVARTRLGCDGDVGPRSVRVADDDAVNGGHSRGTLEHGVICEDGREADPWACKGWWSRRSRRKRYRCGCAELHE